jgi:ribulose-5-phosphate 4-epimerase/fuculose-1-phosphate aldolase
LALVEYRGLARGDFKNPQLARITRGNGEALLRNHGMLVVADDAVQAFYAAYYLEEACRLQVITLSQGQPLHYPDESTVTTAAAQLRRDRPDAARATFDALFARLGHAE